MSDLVSSLHAPKGQRPLWHAGMVSLIAQATAALIPAMMIREAMIRHLDEAREIGVAPIVRPEMLTSAWFGELTIACGWAFLCVIPGTLLFMAIVRWLERREPATTLEWTIAGTASALPLAAGLCVLVAGTVHLPVLMDYLIAASVPCAIGLFGGVLAWHLCRSPRHDWSDPL